MQQILAKVQNKGRGAEGKGKGFAKTNPEQHHNRCDKQCKKGIKYWIIERITLTSGSEIGMKKQVAKQPAFLI